MNILQVVPELNAGGVERTVAEINEALIAAGHGSHVASEGGRLEPVLTDDGAVLHTLPMASKNPLHVRPNTKALIDVIKRENIDIVHARSRAPAWAAKAAAEATGRKFVTTYHGIYNARSRIKRRYNAVMTKGDLVIANSEYTKAHIINEHGTDADKIVVIPRGVDMDVFDPAKVKPDDIVAQRQAWNAPESTPLILLPGRLTRWKGQIFALNAFKQIADAGQDFYLVMLGDPQGRDKYVREIQDLAAASGLQERVHIAPHSDDMPTAYASADLVLSASTDPEAFGRVAAEAGAIGRVILASAHGGSLETVIDGKTGFLFAPNDETALAQAIQSALDTPAAQQQRMAQDAHLHIKDNYSKTRMQNSTLALYTRILEQ